MPKRIEEMADVGEDGAAADATDGALYSRTQICGALGSSLLLAWLWSLWFAGGALGSLDKGSMPGLVQLLFSAGLGASLIVLCAGGHRFAGIHNHAGMRIGCFVSCAAICGMLLGPWPNQTFALDALWALVGVLSAAALRDAIGFWAGVSRQRIAQVVGCCAFGACAIDVLGSFLMPGAATVFVCAQLPGAMVLLGRAAASPPCTSGVAGAAPEDGFVLWMRRFYRASRPLALGLPLYGLVYGFVCSIGMNLYATNIGPVSAFAALAVPAAVMAAPRLRRARLGYGLLQVIAAVTAIAFLPLLSAGEEGLSEIMHLSAHVALLACINGFYLCSCVLQVRVASARNLPATRACLTGHMLYVTGIVAGWAFGMASYILAGLGSRPLHVETAIMIAALILCAIMLGRSSIVESHEHDDEAGLLNRKCNAIVRACGLSKREAELLVLTVHGIDSAGIEQQLFISKNTVKTHMRHIYAKTGVHSRDDLVGFVTSWKLE